MAIDDKADLGKTADPSVVGYEVIEFLGKGDPMFGGSADDRPLGKSGEFLRGSYSQSAVAQFATRALAESAAERAVKRHGSRVGVIPIRDYSRTPQPPGPVAAVDREGHEYRSLDDYTERKIREEQEAARKKADRVPPGKARCSICGKVGSKANLTKHEAKCRTGDCGHGESESGESGDWSPTVKGSFAYLRLDGTRLHVRHNAHVGTWSWSAGSSDGTVLGRGETHSKKTAQQAAITAASEGTR